MRSVEILQCFKKEETNRQNNTNIAELLSHLLALAHLLRCCIWIQNWIVLHLLQRRGKTQQNLAYWCCHNFGHTHKFFFWLYDFETHLEDVILLVDVTS